MMPLPWREWFVDKRAVIVPKERKALFGHGEFSHPSVEVDDTGETVAPVVKLRAGGGGLAALRRAGVTA